jgi:predicted O-methyltransferase YrrM
MIFSGVFMFHTIPQAMLERMAYLEEIDTRDRQDGTPHGRRLRQIPADTGKFLALWAASAPNGRCLEIGTSAGYSTMWLSLAKRPLTTFEVLAEKVVLAQETFAQAAITEMVTLIHGDARDYLPDVEDVAFCFLDAEKDVYEDCYDLLVPRMANGGILVIDNAISHQDALRPFIERVLADVRVDSVVVPIGKGELVVRKI